MYIWQTADWPNFAWDGARHLGVEQAGFTGKPTAESEAMARLLVTATRDLADLLAKGCLQQLPGGGRSTRYRVSG